MLSEDEQSIRTVSGASACSHNDGKGSRQVFRRIFAKKLWKLKSSRGSSRSVWTEKEAGGHECHQQKADHGDQLQKLYLHRRSEYARLYQN